MSEPSISGVCRLCRELKILRLSHVWPSFLYKNYISDREKGGQILAITRNGPSFAKQEKRHWLCDACEAIFSESEDVAARLLRRMERNQGSQHEYGEHLFRFAISICWRIMYFMHENYNSGIIEAEYPACRIWREFLLSRSDSVGGFTPHAFVIFDKKHGSHKVLSSDVYEKQLVITQCGPILLIGRLSANNKDEIEARLWRRSEINQQSGLISVLGDWHIGRNVSSDLHRIISLHFREIMGRIRKFGQGPRPKLPRR